MTLSVISYIIYLVLSIGIIFWVAEVLFSNAHIFIDDIFHGDRVISDSTSKLLKLGFYLLNFGFVLFLMKSYGIRDSKALFEVLSIKIGTIILILGGIYLVNIYSLFKFRKKARLDGNYRLSEEKKLKLEAIERDEFG